MPLVSQAFGDIITFTRASTATYFNSAGTLQSAATDAPRLDYDPSTLAAQGLLIEESRTNSIRNNTMQGAVAGSPGTAPTNWAVTSTGGVFTRTIVGAGTENGVAYFEVRLQASGAGTAALQFDQGNVIAATVGQNWSTASYLKLVGGSYTNITDSRIVVTEYDSGSIFLSAGATSFTATGSALSTQRVAHSRTLASATTAFVVSSIQIVFSGAGDITLRIGLPQLELGAFATSVIPTTTTALTRAADVASVNTLSPWYNATEGTLYAEYNIPFALAPATNPTFAAFVGTGGIGTNAIGAYINSPSGTGKNGSFNVWSSGSIVGRIDVSENFVADSVVRYAAAFAANDRAVTSGGATPTTSATAYIVPTVSSMDLGVTAPLSSINGYLRRITYYPRRLSNAELQAMTV
jgi:hypothetical protein